MDIELFTLLKFGFALFLLCPLHGFSLQRMKVFDFIFPSRIRGTYNYENMDISEKIFNFRETLQFLEGLERLKLWYFREALNISKTELSKSLKVLELWDVKSLHVLYYNFNMTSGNK